MNEISNEIINNINLCNCVEVYFVNPDYDISDASDYKIAKLNIDDSVVNVAKTIVGVFFKGIKEKQQVAIDELEAEDDRYIITLNLHAVENLSSIIQLVKDEKYKTFNPHNSEAFLERLKYYIIFMKINDKEYYFIRRYSKNSLLVPKKLFFICKENTFQYIENETIFTLDNVIDAFVNDDLVYIINDKQFSFVTGYYKKEEIKANSVLDKFESASIVSNFNELREHCMSKVSYMKRLSKVEEDTLKNISFNSIVQLKNNRGTDFVVNKENRNISFENKVQLENVINIVLDNFVVSEITEMPYISLNKRNYKSNIK